MKRVLATVVLAFALFLFSGTVFGNNVPPSPTNSFYGDATGDMIIDAADIAQAKAWTLGLPYTYDTIQPAFPTQDWNTSDVTSDILIDAADLSALKSWTLGFTVVIPDKPWVLSNENLPLVANPIATPIAFQVNLASTVGTAFGRSGIPVVVQINAAASTTTGSLVGRTCAPLAGSRDQSSGAGDQCALSVSITDWYGAPGATKGLTETGTYGLKVIGNATGNLRLVFSIDSYPPGLDIPAITLGVVVGFSGNSPPSFTTTGGTTARQGLLYSYTPALTDAEVGQNLSCSLGTLNTCGGTLPADTPGVKPHTCTSYTFTPGAGLQSCQFRIVATDNGVPVGTAGQTTTVTINRAPTWSTAPSNIAGVALGSTRAPAVDGIATDADVPAQILTCSSGGTSCPFTPTVTGSSVAPTSCLVGFTANLTAQTCNLRIVVTDAGSPAATLGSTITITTVNNAPTFTTTGGTTGAQGVPYSYTAGTTDADTGENLTCTLGTLNTCAGTLPADTPGVKPHNCTAYTFTPGAALQSCQYRIVVTDNGVPAATAGQTTTVTINRKPTWSTAPSNIVGVALGSTRAPAVDGIATDVDVPAQILTCSSGGTSCTFVPTVTGSSVAPTSCLVGFTANLTAQTCNLRIVVTDAGSPAATLGSTITITTVNNAPTFTGTGGTTAKEGVLYSYTAATTDADTGENLTCTLGTLNTCVGALPADTPGVKPHNCTAYTFTPGAGLQSCQYRIVVTDNGVPAATAGQTTTVTINRNPTWSTIPADITITNGSVYGPTVNGVTTDADVPAQNLSCSTNSTNCPMAITVTGGPAVAPVNCSVSFTSTLAPLATCTYREVVTDTGVPAASLVRVVTITGRAVNNPPAFSTIGPTTGRQGLLYTYTAGTTDAQPAQLLTCTLGTVNTCGGTLPADTPGVSPHNCTAYTFTPGAGLQSCQFRLVVTDNGGGALTAGQTTTVTINRAPTWSTAPSNITAVPLGSTRAPTVDGIATDVDVPAQVLTCSSGGTSCTFVPTVTGSSVSPTSCLVGFTANLTAQTCNLRIVVTDAGAPAATLGSTITITTVNNAPTFSTTGGTTGAQGVPYSYTAGTTDADTGENLTCTLGTLNTCAGALPADTPGVKPHNCTAYTFTPGAGLQSCQYRIVVTDNGVPAATAGQTTTVTINRTPTWSTAPSNITAVPLGSTRAPTVDGIATDVDVPAQILTCSSGGTSCTFVPTVTGSSVAPTSCLVGFTANLTAQTCNLRIVVTDAGSPADTLGATITITTVNNAPTFTTLGGTTGAQGVPYSYTAATTDVDTGENLTCTLGTLNTCAGALPADTPGVKPHNCTAYTFTPGAGLQSCQYRIVVTDNGVPAATAGQTTTVTINRTPTWSTAPSNIVGVALGSTRAPAVDGIATDVDVPAQILTCSSGGTSCPFVPTVTGSSVAPTSCLVGFTATLTVQTCNLRIVVTDAGLPADTLGATITITTVNNPPTWSTAPGAIGANTGQVYSAVDGIATDADTGETLTCSANGTSCVGFPVGPTVTGSSVKPASCTVGFTAPAAGQVCNLRIMVTDNGVPAATLGSTIVITITATNLPPAFSTTGGTTARQGLLYSYTAGTTDPNAADLLTCTIGTVNTCAGTLPADTPGVSPHNCTAYTFTPGAGLQTCQFRLVVTDNGAGALTAGQTTTVTINRAPTWSTAPSNITAVPLGSTRAPTVDGIATDVDVPAQVLTCSSGGTSCTFVPTVTGSSVSPTSCLVGFTANLTAQTCNLRIVVTDAGAPAATLGSTITITTVNNAPTFTTTGGTTGAQGVPYSYTAATTDADTGENLTCTLGTLNTCAGTLPADTPGVKPHNCTAYTFTPGAGLQSCQYRIVVTDNGVPAATAGQTTTVTINRTPTWSTAPSNIVGVALGSTRAPAVDGIATDVDVPAQILTCSSGGTSCTFVPTVTGSSVAPTSCLVGFTANLTAQTCNLRIVVTDAGTPAATLGATITITTVNNPPTWTTAPVNITLCPGSVYNQNSISTDADTGETLTCSNSGALCAATVTGASVKPVTCNLTGSMGGAACNLRMMVADNGVPSASLGATVTLTPRAVGCGSMTWASTGTQTAVAAFDTPPNTFSIQRIRMNYPSNWNRVVLNFSGALTAACAATVNCNGVAQTVTPTFAGTSCILTVTSGGGTWRENSECTISAVTSTPACTNCAGLTSPFRTSMLTANCAPRGGSCGGFIDDGTYGTGNTLTVDVVDFRKGTAFCGEAAVCGTATNLNHAYVLVEQPNQTPLVRIEKFDANDDGSVAVTGLTGDLLKSDVIKVTAAYKGVSGMCENTLGEYTKCYQISTFDTVDSRHIKVPMEFTTSADYQLPEAQIWGYVPIEGFSKFVGPRIANLNSFPDPLRGGFVILSLLDQSMSSINLADLLRTTGDASTISLCFGGLGANIGNLKLPGNLILPDLIRQTWNAGCGANMKASPGNTVFRIFTNRPSVTRTIIAMGASVRSALFNVYSGLNIAALPITMTAMGTMNVNIPALPYSINLGESGGNFGQGSRTPRSVPLEFDFRLAGSYATATGRRVQLNDANFALDQERVRIGTGAVPNYGDPNRAGAQHVGQFYILGETLLIQGARSGAVGLIPFQLKMVPDIDDNQFTVFQRMNTQSKAFANVEPWGNGGLTQVISSYVLGLPSTTADTEVAWASATPGLVGISLRGFLDSWSASGAASMPTTIPGSSASVQFVNGTLESIQNTVQGTSSWLPLPEITDPTHAGYGIPPQGDSRGWPINRNGQIVRGTATIANVIHKMAAGNAIGARYFTLRNPAVTTAATRYADLYFLTIFEPGRTHIVNPFMHPIRGYPDNNLWRMFGPVNSQATLTVTLPFIMPRRAQISGANGIVPDPFEAGNVTNQKLEWNLAESTFDTTATGVNGPYYYQNLNITWWYQNTSYSASETHQFWWQ